MSVKREVEKLERRVGMDDGQSEPCKSEKCAELARAFEEAYNEPPGSFVIRHSPAVCNQLHASIEKAYEGGVVKTLCEIAAGRGH